MSGISACSPLRRLGHQPRDRKPTDNRHDGKHETCLVSAKTQFTNAEESRIDKDTAQQPAHEVLAQIARDGLVFCQFRHWLPSGDLRPNFAVELHEGIDRLCWR